MLCEWSKSVVCGAMLAHRHFGLLERSYLRVFMSERDLLHDLPRQASTQTMHYF